MRSNTIPQPPYWWNFSAQKIDNALLAFFHNLENLHTPFYQKPAKNKVFQELYEPCEKLLALFYQPSTPPRETFTKRIDQIAEIIASLGETKSGRQDKNLFYSQVIATLQSAYSLKSMCVSYFDQYENSVKKFMTQSGLTEKEAKETLFSSNQQQLEATPAHQKKSDEQRDHDLAKLRATLSGLKASPVPRTYPQATKHFVTHNPGKTALIFFASCLIAGSQVSDEVASEFQFLLGGALLVTLGSTMHRTINAYYDINEAESQTAEHTILTLPNPPTWADLAYEETLNNTVQSLFQAVGELSDLLHRKLKYNTILGGPIQQILLQLHTLINNPTLPDATDVKLASIITCLSQQTIQLTSASKGGRKTGEIAAAIDKILAESNALKAAVTRFLGKVEALETSCKEDNPQEEEEPKENYKKRITEMVNSKLHQALSKNRDHHTSTRQIHGELSAVISKLERQPDLPYLSESNVSKAIACTLIFTNLGLLIEHHEFSPGLILTLSIVGLFTLAEASIFYFNKARHEEDNADSSFFGALNRLSASNRNRSGGLTQFSNLRGSREASQPLLDESGSGSFIEMP